MPQHEAGTPLFTDMECARVRTHLHVALPVVLSLIDQLYDTRQRLLSLTAAVAAQDKNVQAAIIQVTIPEGAEDRQSCD